MSVHCDDSDWTAKVKQVLERTGRTRCGFNRSAVLEQRRFRVNMRDLQAAGHGPVPLGNLDLYERIGIILPS